MKIYQVAGTGYFEDVIRTFKRRTQTRHSSQRAVPLELSDPLPLAQYLVARTDDGTTITGLAEGYFLDQMHNSYATVAPDVAAAVAPLCALEHLAFFQTIYVEPAFRSRQVYLYLCLALVHLGVELGARGGVCFTHADSTFHRSLYEKLGGTLVAPVAIDYGNGTVFRDVAYYFDLRALCEHPRMPRVLACSHFDKELAYESDNWRYERAFQPHLGEEH